MGKPRPYHAPARQVQAEQTRARVLAAAHDLFARQGLATTMRQVAERAEVSQATVELLFGTKAALLNAVVDVALAGDDEPVPVLEREWVRDLQALDVGQFLDAVCAAFAAGAGRVSAVLGALDEGSTRHPALTTLAERMRRNRTVMADWVVAGVTARDALTADLTRQEATETVLVLIDPRLQRRLLIEEGWPVDRLAQWTGRCFRRLLLETRSP